jgi:hypothetical protein
MCGGQRTQTIAKFLARDQPEIRLEDRPQLRDVWRNRHHSLAVAGKPASALLYDTDCDRFPAEHERRAITPCRGAMRLVQSFAFAGDPGGVLLDEP